jgi:hypothetical protein
LDNECAKQASLAMVRSGSRRTGKPTYSSMMTWFGPAMCGAYASTVDTSRSKSTKTTWFNFEHRKDDVNFAN